MKKELITKLEELLENTNVLEIVEDTKSIIEEFNNETKREIKEQKNLFVEEGGDAHYFEPAKNVLDSKFKEIENLYNDRLTKVHDDRKAELQKNLELKEALIEELKDLNQNEENIGKAFNRLDAIKKKWGGIGTVPKNKTTEIRHDYSQLVEEFYYHIKIYKELKDHDLKKNLEKKNSIIERIEALIAIKSIKETQTLLDALHTEWDSVGPVPQLSWPDTKDRFYKALNDVLAKVRGHFKEIRDKQKENSKLKKELIEEVTTLVENVPEKFTEWNQLAEQVQVVQEKFRKSGGAPKQINQKLWDEFKAVVDGFYDKRKKFFDARKQEFKGVKDSKSTIIKKAEDLLPKEDEHEERINWKELSTDIINLQKQWKTAGTLPQNEERKLWSKFRGICDKFFNQKKGFYEGQDDRNSKNLDAKEQIIEKLKTFEPSKDQDKDLESLKSLTLDFQSIGMVPFKDKNKVNATFNAVSKHATSLLNIKQRDFNQMMFSNKLDILTSQENDPLKALEKELRFSKGKIQTNKEEKLQYENNLGFFQYTPDDNPMKKEVIDKIAGIDQIIAEWELKRKTISISIKRHKEAIEAANSEATTEKND
jgi:hypothetical protein|tara:strand:- start:447 stop:2228 length:1782 start_codon:yes stop_codon:yes gene_type:complete